MDPAMNELSELMAKLGDLPEFECVILSDAEEDAKYEYRCTAYGLVVTASAGSQAEAKQKVARRMLQELGLRGHPISSEIASAAMLEGPADAIGRQDENALGSNAYTDEERSYHPGAIAEYHLGLTARLDAPTRDRTYAALAQSRAMSPMSGLAAVAAALCLDLEYSSLPRTNLSPLCVVELKNCSPDLAFSGSDQTSAAEAAMTYLRHSLARSESEAEEATLGAYSRLPDNPDEEFADVKPVEYYMQFPELLVGPTPTIDSEPVQDLERTEVSQPAEDSTVDTNRATDLEQEEIEKPDAPEGLNVADAKEAGYKYTTVNPEATKNPTVPEDKASTHDTDSSLSLTELESDEDSEPADPFALYPTAPIAPTATAPIAPVAPIVPIAPLVPVIPSVSVLFPNLPEGVAAPIVTRHICPHSNREYFEVQLHEPLPGQGPTEPAQNHVNHNHEDSEEEPEVF